MGKAESRSFIIEIVWGDCDASGLLVEELKTNRGDFDFKLLGQKLRLSSPNLENIMQISRTIITRLEEAGCQPLFSLSTEVPRDIAILSNETDAPSGSAKGNASKRKARL
ncbi:hypothetical protein B9Q03_07865 [Candidatus Marsarchaeota G2 archaeon OSP_D]|uniref:Uncharacterized protein n=7 Tax=Candidatus Marsarchaeota group 2 TaxID=2203771 RepID=A0A2R6CBH1_9ARCH|nr:MAG: hypothetical protein B9Q03_07865 [Candidatus Marsarchaeota G2 archaeon OSP_D]PSN90773.1 MAG: hypothetical protein B9Q08_03985 [Candidatus Marsarchaeota G2 archaeon ECH_B_SAG-M15]PSN93132.1 MAG: hypothetical protein B9Q09_06440 [Candidatus Marsarchaeota G2 archaeon ECH_B_SAG-C16]PSN94074.1 MAG: hypothetical protein B9Q06_10305 [Candidatus Marsarchaeota G2 archaeon ECH_B_2]PSN98552.1 MAG: hypothetical protein B9Q07_09440 [Candidatus Marsarchaeota G2 archaeon ECH_B_3]PSO00271.1 MAG: hypot